MVSRIVGVIGIGLLMFSTLFASVQMSDFLAQQYRHELLQKPISLSVGPIKLQALITRIAAHAGLSVLCAAPLNRVVPFMRVHCQPVGQLLHMLLAGNSPPLAVLVVGRTLHIGKRAAITKQAHTLLTGTIVSCQAVTLTIAHLPWDDALKLRLESMWQQCTTEHVGPTRRQYFFCDDAGRRVLVQGTPTQVNQFKQMVAACDTAVPQVQLQARVVVTRSSVIERMGFSTQVAYQPGRGRFGFAGVGDVPGAAIVSGLRTVAPESGLGLSLPFVFGGSDLATQRLNLVLDLAERRQQVRTLLAPQLISVSGKQADLLEGQRVPIESMVEESNEGRVRNVRSVDYKEVGVQLKVKPRVLPDNERVRLELFVEHSQVAPSATTVRYPTLQTSRIKNQVILRSGQTVLLGGLVRQDERQQQAGVPWLSRLPLIGHLFKGTADHAEQQRLYVFVSVRLV